MDPAPAPFLDVPVLLHGSAPRVRSGWFVYAAAGFLLVVLLATVAGRQGEPMRQAVEVLSAAAMIALMAVLSVLTVRTVRKHRADQQEIEGAGELVQLRRWPEAAALLQRVLSRPARSLRLRSQALIYLSAVLARYHRFDDAIAVQNHLLDNDLVDPQTAYGLRLGRAMALLHEDRLVDADRAMGELRRLAGKNDSAGLALVEIYRDVKTGHPEEAVALFEEKLPALRQQLGHRLGDAYALVARAHDLLGRSTEAADAFQRATLLSPAVELQRRYPEVSELLKKYPAAPAPPDLAAAPAPGAAAPV